MQASTTSIVPASTARHIVGIFVQKGKKHKSECIIRSRALQIKPSSKLSDPNYDSFTFNHIDSNTNKTPLSKLFHQFTLAATPFVSLKTRRRAKRASVKVGHLPRSRGFRISFRALVGIMRSAGKSTSFSKKLFNQLDVLGPSAKSRSSSRREQRDDVHKQAFRSRPLQ